MSMLSMPRWMRFAYVAVKDPACRTRVVGALRTHMWRVEERSTGFHLIQDLADIIIGEPNRVAPGLIVIDANASGCSGLSIAHGLRDLGIAIPVVVIASSLDPQAVADQSIVVVHPAKAPEVVTRIVLHPRHDEATRS